MLLVEHMYLVCCVCIILGIMVFQEIASLEIESNLFMGLVLNVKLDISNTCEGMRRCRIV